MYDDSLFFSPEILREYSRGIAPALRKNNVSLLSVDGFRKLASSSGPGHSITRRSKLSALLKNPDYVSHHPAKKKTTNVRRTSRSQIANDTRDNAYLQSFLNNCPSIDSEYLTEALNLALDPDTETYDAVFIMDRSMRLAAIEATRKKRERRALQAETKNMAEEDKGVTSKSRKSRAPVTEEDVYYKETYKYHSHAASRILGVLLIQYGECATLPNAVSVKLICAKRIKETGVRSAENLGTILLGLFVYTLKYLYESGADLYPFGILELVNGYENPAGYCSYSKFGFTHDASIELGNCYPSADLLPMSVDIQRDVFTEQNIFDVVNGGENRIAGKTPILCIDALKTLDQDDPDRQQLVVLQQICDFIELLIVEKNLPGAPPGYKVPTNARLRDGLATTPFLLLKEMILDANKTKLYEKLVDRKRATFLKLSITDIAEVYKTVKKEMASIETRISSTSTM